MSDDECGRPCVDHLLNELQLLWRRYHDEYDITVVEFVGCLEAVKYVIFAAVEEE